MSLPAALKQLLAQRAPGALASPGLARLSPVLGTTLDEARAYRAENGWLCVTTATLLTANSPAAVGDLYSYVTRSPPPSSSSAVQSDGLGPKEERVARAALMREVALKCSVFVGVPKVINSLAGLTAALDPDVKESLRDTPTRTAENTRVGMNGVVARGRRLFASVYDPHTEKLLAKLGSYHPDFPDFILQNEYGALLSDPPHDKWSMQGRVGRALTSATGVACLRASGGVGPQLTSHVYGLLKARNYEADRAAAGTGQGEEWLSTPEGATWVIDTVDKLMDVVKGSGGLSAAAARTDGTGAWNQVQS